VSLAIETKIWLALKSRIDTLPFGWGIAWPGEVFRPAGNAPYLRVGMVHAAPARKYVDNGNPYERTGFLILTIVHPLNGTMTAQHFEQMAGTIADHFRDDTKMHSCGLCVSVPEYPQSMGGYAEGGYWQMPVRIRWRCHA
jgi:hypothetical protein